MDDHAAQQDYNKYQAIGEQTRQGMELLADGVRHSHPLVRSECHEQLRDTVFEALRQMWKIMSLYRDKIAVDAILAARQICDEETE